MKSIYEEIEDFSSEFYAIWSGLNSRLDKNNDGNIDDFGLRGLLGLLFNAAERLDMLSRNHKKLSQDLSLEKDQQNNSVVTK